MRARAREIPTKQLTVAKLAATNRPSDTNIQPAIFMTDNKNWSCARSLKKNFNDFCICCELMCIYIFVCAMQSRTIRCQLCGVEFSKWYIRVFFITRTFNQLIIIVVVVVAVNHMLQHHVIESLTARSYDTHAIRVQQWCMKLKLRGVYVCAVWQAVKMSTTNSTTNLSNFNSFRFDFVSFYSGVRSHCVISSWTVGSSFKWWFKSIQMNNSTWKWARKKNVSTHSASGIKSTLYAMHGHRCAFHSLSQVWNEFV